MRVFVIGKTGSDHNVIHPLVGTNESTFAVDRDVISAGIRDEIARLEPEEIIIVGGILRVGQGVEAALTAIAPVTRIAGSTYDNTMIELSQYMNPVIEPPVEPPVEPPPTGLYIPKLEGPILTHDGDPEILRGALEFSTDTVLKNVKIIGSIRPINGARIWLEDFEIDGNAGGVAVRGYRNTGGEHVYMKRGVIHNAEDGMKDNCSTEQVVVHDLRWNSGAHGDCHQLQSGGAKGYHNYSYFDARYYNTVNPNDPFANIANAAFIIKNDLGSNEEQEILVENSYINGGNFCVFLRDAGSKLATRNARFRNVRYGGLSRWGQRYVNGSLTGWDYRYHDLEDLVQSLSADVTPAEWDVTLDRQPI